MNKIYNIKYFKHVSIVLVILAFFSCNKNFLENESKATLNDANQWSTGSNADIFLNDIYGSLPRWNNTPDQLDNYTDDNDAGSYWQCASWKQGILTPNTPAFNYTQFDGLSDWANWANAYTQIRKCNLFLQKVKENIKNFTADTIWYKKRVDEARFIRAFTYSYMLMHYGGLPIITHPQNRTNEGNAIDQPRNTFEETVNFITSQLDSIVKDKALAVKYTQSNADAGRATLGAALALKGYVELFAASPAFNADLPAAANGTGASGDQIKLAGYGNYDAQRWAKAAATNKQFIDSYEGAYQLFPDLSTFWTEANEYNVEVIFDKQHIRNTLASNFEVFGGIVYILNTYYSWGNYCPTQELVDNFGMANGKPINDPTSGYDTLHPYLNRDKRFYDFIVYDGAPYKTSWMPITDTIRMRIDKVHKSMNQIDFATSDVTNTGYYFKKRINPDIVPGWGQSGLNYVFFRYTEVLLNYAEAQNEAVGPDASVYSAIDKIRTRSKLQSLELTYGALTQDQMRNVIRSERRVELCFENKRFFDIVRWKTAEDVMNKDLHGMKITNTVPKDNSGYWQYTRIGIGHPHVFTNKMYLCPIDQSVIDRNSRIIQNPGF